MIALEQELTPLPVLLPIISSRPTNEPERMKRILDLFDNAVGSRSATGLTLCGS